MYLKWCDFKRWAEDGKTFKEQWIEYKEDKSQGMGREGGSRGFSGRSHRT